MEEVQEGGAPKFKLPEIKTDEKNNRKFIKFKGKKIYMDTLLKKLNKKRKKKKTKALKKITKANLKKVLIELFVKAKKGKKTKKTKAKPKTKAKKEVKAKKEEDKKQKVPKGLGSRGPKGAKSSFKTQTPAQQTALFNLEEKRKEAERNVIRDKERVKKLALNVKAVDTFINIITKRKKPTTEELRILGTDFYGEIPKGEKNKLVRRLIDAGEINMTEEFNEILIGAIARPTSTRPFQKAFNNDIELLKLIDRRNSVPGVGAPAPAPAPGPGPPPAPGPPAPGPPPGPPPPADNNDNDQSEIVTVPNSPRSGALESKVNEAVDVDEMDALNLAFLSGNMTDKQKETFNKKLKIEYELQQIKENEKLEALEKERVIQEQKAIALEKERVIQEQKALALEQKELAQKEKVLKLAEKQRLRKKASKQKRVRGKKKKVVSKPIMDIFEDIKDNEPSVKKSKGFKINLGNSSDDEIDDGIDEEGLLDDGENDFIEPEELNEQQTKLDEDSELLEELRDAVKEVGIKLSASSPGAERDALRDEKRELRKRQNKQRVDFKKLHGKPALAELRETVVGAGTPPDVLNNDQIDKMMKRYRPTYQGALPRDYIKNLIFNNPKAKGCAVINTDPSSEPGEHWCGLYWDNKSICWYNPLGNSEIPSDIKADLKLLNKALPSSEYRKLKFSTVKNQPITNQQCGWFASNWCIDMIRSNGNFKKSTKYNTEDQVDKSMKRFEYLFD